MDHLAFRLNEVWLVLLVLQELLLLVELFAPSVKSNAVIAFICLQDLLDDFGIFFTQSLRLGFTLLHKFDPVVQ